MVASVLPVTGVVRALAMARRSRHIDSDFVLVRVTVKLEPELAGKAACDGVGKGGSNDERSVGVSGSGGSGVDRLRSRIGIFRGMSMGLQAIIILNEVTKP